MTSAVTLAQSASTGVTLGFKNRIINGNFEIWQRNPSGASVFQSVTYAGADRWCSAGFQQARVSRITVPVGSGPISRFACRVGSSPASDNSNFGTRMSLRQKIEFANCYDLAGQSVTLSFWVRFSGASFPSLANTQSSAFGPWRYSILFNTTTTDSPSSSDVQGDSSTSAPLTNGSLPTGWTRYTLTAQVPSNCNNVSVNFQFDQLGTTASETSQWYDVTDVQLEVGTTATAFDERPYTLELLLSQRYCVVIGPTAGPQNYSDNYYRFATVAVGESGGSATTIFQYPVLMRATPSFSATGAFQLYDGSFYTVTSVTYASFGPFNACITYQAPGLTNGRAYHPLAGNNQTARQVFSAEL